ncbi:hypothetical protein QBC39DRAFT_270072 [Podospora conica]|nr:hypothetical protein QBC39DRAFT_270072 [Schizothecium conicum]
MPDVCTSDFTVARAVFGIFAACFALVSFHVKERLFISESLLALLAGVIAGLGVTNFIKPAPWVRVRDAELRTTTLDFWRLVLSIQVMLRGVQLPAKFTKHSRRSLGAVLGPGMLGMWITRGFLVWAVCVTPTDGARMPFLHTLAIGACMSPTDPELAVTVTKGRWADHHVKPELSHLISAESGIPFQQTQRRGHLPPTRRCENPAEGRLPRRG